MPPLPLAPGGQADAGEVAWAAPRPVMAAARGEAATRTDRALTVPEQAPTIGPRAPQGPDALWRLDLDIRTASIAHAAAQRDSALTGLAAQVTELAARHLGSGSA
ncbi:hypothetical protein JBE27_16095 [Streptomyces albiflaviniger]|nr:hypothetical protein [Streptomyces albiflaviniger]